MDIIVPLLVVLGVIVFWAVITYNKLVSRRERVRESWSGMDVQLKRRSNVVGNLVSTVKGYAAHERETLEAVTQMRARAEAAADGDTGARQAAEGELSTALIRLFAVAENYPELKADGTFVELQKTLSDLEDEIQMARRFYNGSVRNLNTSIGSVPSNIIAKQFGFQPAEYYEVDHAADKILPKVSF
ncbi:MAG: LemA family protein [Alphaproteobacteria bacterium]